MENNQPVVTERYDAVKEEWIVSFSFPYAFMVEEQSVSQIADRMKKAFSDLLSMIMTDPESKSEVKPLLIK